MVSLQTKPAACPSVLWNNPDTTGSGENSYPTFLVAIEYNCPSTDLAKKR